MSYKNRDLELRSNLDLLCNKFRKGQFLDMMDFEQLGLDSISSRYAIRVLKDEYDLDILVVRRGVAIVGWILAEELL